MASEITIGLDEDKVFWCERDNVYIGVAAAPYVDIPAGHSEEWLNSHCWVCGREQTQIAHDQLEDA